LQSPQANVTEKKKICYNKNATHSLVQVTISLISNQMHKESSHDPGSTLQIIFSIANTRI